MGGILKPYFCVLESNAKVAAPIFGYETAADIIGVGAQHQIGALIFARETTAGIFGVGIQR